MKKSDFLLKQTQTSDYPCIKIPYSNGKLEEKYNLIKAIKRVTFGFRTFCHLRMRILIQQNLCDII
ncbi:TPA: transposase [Enterococcus faecalis]|nr:transposase [Enterococcus faecalis]HBI1562875.1 transposase [Enterococcus faecalis]HBI1565995.1 transposase [Enterococcus faecalis]HBI1717718.1 transposase [Enterococcus faecalis]HBI1720457.1 transposase [Enterococcus faecalis]